LCDPCRKHFGTVEELLTRANVPYTVNPRLVRGLDYYTRTTFEAISKAVGAQSAVVAGGRYDGLVEALGGAAVAGTGFAVGVERIALALDAARFKLDGAPDVAIIAMGERATVNAMDLARSLRAANLRVEMFSPERGLKALLRRADKVGARYALIMGENELARGVVQVRDLKASTQREIANHAVAAEIAAGSPD
jgi:histidyl-tRNA synthetase